VFQTQTSFLAHTVHPDVNSYAAKKRAGRSSAIACVYFKETVRSMPYFACDFDAAGRETAGILGKSATIGLRTPL
jgi:hypothetical protein